MKGIEVITMRGGAGDSRCKVVRHRYGDYVITEPWNGGKGWQITHSPSGLGMGKPVRTLVSAKATASRLSRLRRWSGPLPDRDLWREMMLACGITTLYEDAVDALRYSLQESIAAAVWKTSLGVEALDRIDRELTEARKDVP